jgi:hypothetical protein
MDLLAWVLIWKLFLPPPPPKATLPVLDNPFSQRVNAIIGKVREMRRGPYWPNLYIVKEDGDAAMRMWALSMLIEDRAEPLPSYNQWLSIIKDKVRVVVFVSSTLTSAPVCYECEGADGNP